VQIINSLLQKMLSTARARELPQRVVAPQLVPVPVATPPEAGPGGREEPSDNFWLAAMATLLADNESQPTPRSGIEEAYTAANAKKKTLEQMAFVQSQLEELSDGFNRLINSQSELKPLHVTSARFTKANLQEGPPTVAEFPRYRLTSGALSLVVVGTPGTVEIFELPAEQLHLAAGQERGQRRRLAWTLIEKKNTCYWYADQLPLDLRARTVLLKQLFYDFIKSAWLRRIEGAATKPLSEQNLDKNEAITVTRLIQEKQNLVNKLLSRDEELTSAIARDLHDVIIADIMLLKGRLAADPPNASREEIVEVLDLLTKRLREICYNLTPRDLADWGLKTVLEDLAHQFGKQNDASCVFKCQADLPCVEHAVQLQIYRIVQEGLNNVAKYAQAKNVSISLSSDERIFRIAVEDDGKGFEVEEVGLKRSSDGGTGLHDLRERTELIRCFHPAKLSVLSQPGQGTKVTLEISYRLG